MGLGRGFGSQRGLGLGEGWRVSDEVGVWRGLRTWGQTFGHMGVSKCTGHIQTYRRHTNIWGIWTPPKSPHTSKLKSQEKSCSTAVGTVFFPQVVWEGIRRSKEDTGQWSMSMDMKKNGSEN